ncbi:MAG: hypothetical protein OXG05_11670 [Gammaproteobacteria bacterium]|nr:hypothetical protein [Gammaproteobacteria bacterium]
MSKVLDRLGLKLLSGQEPLTTNDGADLKLLDFWQWSGSCLMDNTQRGVLAEFLVAAALDIHRTPREEWGNIDLELQLHGRPIKIEVKSSSERQSWAGKPSGFHQFDIRRTEDSEGKTTGSRRWADVYVFCILKNRHSVIQTDALDTEKWEFLVLPTQTLEKLRTNQKSIRKGPLLELGAISSNYSELAKTIAETAGDLNE